VFAIAILAKPQKRLRAVPQVNNVVVDPAHGILRVGIPICPARQHCIRDVAAQGKET
jgi:hypothetical protein